MKKLLLLFILISSLSFAQTKGNEVIIDGTNYRYQYNQNLEPETVAVLNYAKANGYSKPADIKPLDQLIKDLKDDGIWDKLDVFYVFSDNSSVSFKLINLINPNLHYATAYGGLTWGIDGVLGNGTNGYIDTNYNPSVSGINFTLNNASIFALVSDVSAPYAFTGTDTGTSRHNQFANYNGNAHRLNSTGGVNVTNVDMSGGGYKFMSRINSTTLEFVNGSVLSDRAQNSLSVPNANQRILQSGGSSSNHKISFFGMGSSLTYSETQSFITNYNAYLTRLGLTPLS